MRKRPVVDMQLVAEALNDAIGEPNDGKFAAGDWVPPMDPRHDVILAESLDPSAPWVKSALIGERGPACELCGGVGADTVQVDDDGLYLAHARCATRPPTERQKARQERLEKIEKGRRRGAVDVHENPQADYTVDPDGSHVPIVRRA
jgi:hypothetical protein